MSIISVSATDADDSPDNRKIEFSIIGGDPQGVFSMENQEPNTGKITHHLHKRRPSYINHTPLQTKHCGCFYVLI